MSVSNQESDQISSIGKPVNGEILKSSEGVGKDLLEDDVDGRLTMDIVGSMHEVCPVHLAAISHAVLVISRSHLL